MLQNQKRKARPQWGDKPQVPDTQNCQENGPEEIFTRLNMKETMSDESC